MRFHFGDTNRLQTSSDMREGWQLAPTPSEKQVQTYGLLTAGVGMLLISFLLEGKYVPRGPLPTLLILAVIMPLHELIHALFTPGWGLSAKTVIGIQTRKGLFMPYVYYEGEQSFWRFLLTGLAPTLFLTVLPILVIIFVPLGDSYRAGLGFVSFFNAGISGGDLFICLWLVTKLTPRGSVLQQGWKLYWKAAT